MSETRFRGVIIPLMTPLDEAGDPDERVLRELVDFEIEAGTHGLFALGSFGQGPALEVQQRMAAAEAVVDQARGRVPIIVHVGCADTPTTVKLARHAEGLGVDGVGVIPPYYYDHSKYEWMAHFEEVAKAVRLPIILYNNKAYCNIDVTPALAREVVDKVPQIVGQKLAYSTLDNLLQHVRALPQGFATFAGTGTLLLPSVPFGVAGVINPQSSLFPELAVEVWRAVEARDWDRAMEAQGRVIDSSLGITRMYKEFGRGVDREVMRLRGFDVKRYPRWPVKPLGASESEQVQALLNRVGLLQPR